MSKQNVDELKQDQVVLREHVRGCRGTGRDGSQVGTESFVSRGTESDDESLRQSQRQGNTPRS